MFFWKNIVWTELDILNHTNASKNFSAFSFSVNIFCKCFEKRFLGTTAPQDHDSEILEINRLFWPSILICWYNCQSQFACFWLWFRNKSDGLFIYWSQIHDKWFSLYYCISTIRNVPLWFALKGNIGCLTNFKWIRRLCFLKHQ